MTETEALYGFVFWLAECPNKVYEIGKAKQHGDIHIALAKFCKENGLPELGDGWQAEIKKPSHYF